LSIFLAFHVSLTLSLTKGEAIGTASTIAPIMLGQAQHEAVVVQISGALS
jgi:hypothetical protein